MQKIVSPATILRMENVYNLEVYDSSDSVNSGSEDEEYGGGDTDVLVKEPYSFA